MNKHAYAVKEHASMDIPSKTLLQLGHSFTDSMAKTLNRSHNIVFVVRRKTLDRAVWQLVSTSCRNRYQALNGLRLHQEIPGLRLH